MLWAGTGANIFRRIKARQLVSCACIWTVWIFYETSFVFLDWSFQLLKAGMASALKATFIFLFFLLLWKCSEQWLRRVRWSLLRRKIKFISMWSVRPDWMVHVTVICGSCYKLTNYEESKTVHKSVYPDISFLASHRYTLRFNRHEQPAELFRCGFVCTIRREYEHSRKEVRRAKKKLQYPALFHGRYPRTWRRRGTSHFVASIQRRSGTCVW